MMKRILLIAFPLLFLLACTQEIVTNYSEDPDVNFGQFETFGWDEPLNMAVDESYNPLVNNDIVNKRIKKVIRDEMEGRGYLFEENDPDLLINFHTMVESKSEVTSYPNNYYFWWRNDLRTIDYKEGTLIIDLIGGATDQLIWQGYASGVLEPEDITLSANDGVRMIFEKYPYRAGSVAKKDIASS